MPARYALRKAELKSEQISAGRMDVDSTLFVETVPKRIIVCFVTTEAFNGSLGTSPFDFKHFDIRQITVSASGANYPNILYDLNWDASQYSRAFYDMHHNVGLAQSADSNGISLAKYKNGWAIFVFDTSNSQDADDNSFDLLKSGTTTINVKFSKAVPAGRIYMIIYGESDSLLLGDSSRTVTTDLTVLPLYIMLEIHKYIINVPALLANGDTMQMSNLTVSYPPPILCNLSEEAHRTYTLYCIVYLIAWITSIGLLAFCSVPRVLENCRNGQRHNRTHSRKNKGDSPILVGGVPLRPLTKPEEVPSFTNS